MLRSLLWSRPLHNNMSIMMAPVAVPTREPQAVAGTEREVVKCDHCKLVQFRTPTESCRRCKQSLLPEQPKLQPVLATTTQPVAAPAGESNGLQVASAVRDLRRVRNLSQRQLAGRMNVPRTYISKIENGKAMPTLSSLDRLARALQVDISALLRDVTTRHKDETAVLTADPFLAEIARYAAHLDATQKSIFINHVREIAQSRTRRLA